MTRQWIEEVAGTCRAFGTDYLHVIIDQAGVNFSVIPALNSLSVEWQSLFHGLPEVFIVDDAPLVARFTLDDHEQMRWLQDISQQLAIQAPLLLFCTYWPFSALANWLTQCMDILQEGRSGILRFYDTRVFPLLFTHILSDEQQEPLMRPALFWAWQDLDGQAKGIKGSGLPPERDEKAPTIDLSDRQLEHLMCISDVIVMLSHCAPPAGMFDSRQSLFSACYQGMVEATRQDLLLDDAREDWVMKKWLADVKTSERLSE